MFRVIFLFFLLSGSQAVEWEANNYPNPTAGQFKNCVMNTTGNLCDLDGVLSEDVRYRLNYHLQQFEFRTRVDYLEQDPCYQKGVRALMAITRYVEGNSTETIGRMASDILRVWTINSTLCQKTIVILVSVEDQNFWVAQNRLTTVSEEEFTKIFVQQKSLFKQGRKGQALENIVEGLRLLFHQHGQIRDSTEAAIQLKRVSPWVWRALALIIFIVVFCCGVLLYCCVSREKSSSGKGDSKRGADEAENPMAPEKSCRVNSITSTERSHSLIKIATVTLTLDYPHRQLNETNSKEELHENEHPKTLDV